MSHRVGDVNGAFRLLKHVLNTCGKHSQRIEVVTKEPHFKRCIDGRTLFKIFHFYFRARVRCPLGPQFFNEGELFLRRSFFLQLYKDLCEVGAFIFRNDIVIDAWITFSYIGGKVSNLRMHAQLIFYLSGDAVGIV